MDTSTDGLPAVLLASMMVEDSTAVYTELEIERDAE